MAWIVALHALLAPALLYAQTGDLTPQAHYCATYSSDAQPEDCSFTSLQMCQESVSGVGGWCGPQSVAPVMPPPPLFNFPTEFDTEQTMPFAYPPAAVPPPPPPPP